MRVAGITGGIATGKSTVADMFVERGAVRIDADHLAHAAVAPGEPAYQQVIAQFGSEFVRPDGTLDRRALGALVFRDSEARRRLETIIHPYVTQGIQQQLSDLRGRPCPPQLVVVEIPLLFEVGLEWLVDVTITVSAEQPTQLQHLTVRTGLSSDEARLRIAAQMPVQEKEQRANYVIRTDGTLESVQQQVAHIWRELTQRD